MSPMMAMGGSPQGTPPGMPMQAPMPPPQPPTQEQMALLDKPSWEEVIGLLKNNVHRSYRIDIETDSTIAGSLESDMSGLSQMMQAVAMFMKETMPIVQAGMLPVEAQKEMLMTITRRARMGMVVEDALDKMKEPAPQQDPALQVAQAKAQADAQKAQMQEQMEQQRMQMEEQAEQQRQQNEMIVEQHKQDAQAKDSAYQNQLETQRDQMQAMLDKSIEDAKAEKEKEIASLKLDFDRWKVQQDNETKIAVAEIASKTSLKQAAMSANAKIDPDNPMEMGDDGEEQPKASLGALVDTVNQALQGMFEQSQSHVQAISGMFQQQQDLFDQKHAQVVDAVTKPRARKIERGADGKIASVDGRPVRRDANGRIEGIE